MIVNSDAVLWYNVGQFGDLGYAVPNPSDDVGSLNPTILEMNRVVGTNLFAMMHHEDADLSTPPSINTVRRMHKLYIRFGQLVLARAVDSATLNLEPQHIQPAGEVFTVYPVPYFKVRNRFMREWATYVLMMLSESMQHSENRKPMEISTAYAASIGKYMKRLYRNMATDLFGKTQAEASVDGFILTEAELGAYNPSAFFTSTEMIDTVPHLGHVFTEDRLAVIRNGVPVTSLPPLQPWPTNLTSHYAATKAFRTAGTDAGNAQDGDVTATGPASAGGGPSFPNVTP
jgi:hypothetical protein